MADIVSDETIEVIIRDSTTSDNELKVNPDGSINVYPTSIATAAELSKKYSTDIVITTSTSEKDVILISNPANSGKQIYLNHIYFSVVTGGRYFLLRAYANPTVTANGTSQAKNSVYVGGTPPASVINVYLDPTTTAKGTRRRTFQTGQFMHTADVTESPFFVIEPGNTLLISALSSGNSSELAVTFVWDEVAV